MSSSKLESFTFFPLRHDVDNEAIYGMFVAVQWNLCQYAPVRGYGYWYGYDKFVVTSESHEGDAGLLQSAVDSGYTPQVMGEPPKEWEE